MSFFSIILDYKWVILFYLSVVILVYLNRKKLQREAPFMYLLKTKIGLNLMDKVSDKFRKFVKIWGYIGIVLAYIGFFFITYELGKSVYDLILEKPGAIGASPVIPGVPIAGLGITFPLVIGWISLFIIMIVHEFSHGIVARAHNVKVKSSGIAFFGPILGAFVEPDEQDLAKQPRKVQLSIFAAGPVSNVLLWIVCMFLMIGIASLVVASTYPTGVKIGIIQNDTLPAFGSGLPEGSIIVAINNNTISNLTDLDKAINSLSPYQEAIVKTDNGNLYNLTATKNPNNETKAYLGILIKEESRKLKRDNLLTNIYYKILLWLLELLQWTGFISINIGLINLFPIFITDGAQMLRKNFDSIFSKDKKRGEQIWKTVNLLGLFSIAILLLLPLVRNIFKLVLSIFFSTL